MKNYLFIICSCLFLLSCDKDALTPSEGQGKPNQSMLKSKNGYQFEAFDVPSAWGNYTSAIGINNSGKIVGNYFTTVEEVHGFVYANAQFTDVKVAGAAKENGGSLYDINEAGTSIGYFQYPEALDVVHSFKRTLDGTITVLPDASPGATLTIARSINSSGTIVGSYLDASFNHHSFILANGLYTTYDKPGAVRTILHGINNQGKMVGFYLDANDIGHGFTLHNGITAELFVPGSTSTWPYSINNAGQIVGEYEDSFGVYHGFLFENGNYTTLDFPGSFDTALLGINDHGTIVGTYDGYSRGLIATPAQASSSR